MQRQLHTYPYSKHTQFELVDLLNTIEKNYSNGI